ncbi:molybdopterin converting factor subunit 1 [Methylovorus sp. MM2]|uniref:molybdopterin converting factor subunit 1 n=1 Tax=Methylovorus sp. MM2 TaxID=1848038 RepID=UPI0007E16107|nr:molybdopterin converting factor subunit 1 [Methylovorus sp. MM2]OAM53158.1 molybdopterin converting factor subunit 1 [Methylovorus sp. MM2]
MIKLLYFARLREALGISEEDYAHDTALTVASLVQVLTARGGVWHEEFGGKKTIRAAINQVLVKSDAVIADGDEVAFFPPVTGG